MRQGRQQRLMQAWCLGLLCVLVLLAGRLDVTAADSGQTRVRVLVAVPDTKGVDVVVGGGHIVDNASYRTLSSYQTLTQGQYDVTVYPQDQSTALYTRTITFGATKDYTLVLYGTQTDKQLAITLVTDDNTIDVNKARVRFGNAQSGSGNVVLTTQGASATIGRALYGQVSSYTPLDPGTYSLVVNDSNSKVVTSANVNFSPGTTMSIFLFGPGTDAPSPALLINVDSSTSTGGATPTTGPTATTIPGYQFSYVTNTPSPGGGQSGGNGSDFPTSTPSAVPSATVTATATIPLGTAAPVPNEIASAALRRAALPVTPCPTTPTCIWFAKTNHAVANGFKRFWDANGGEQRYGLPITEEYQDTSYIDGKVRTVQYFERTRLEYFPENAGKLGEVQETSLGREVLRLLGISG